MSDYIRKQQVIDVLKKVGVIKEDDVSSEFITYEINRIPILDEKEIICKAFERVVQRAEEEYDVMNWDRPWAITINRLKEIIKEECGLNG